MTTGTISYVLIFCLQVRSTFHQRAEFSGVAFFCCIDELGIFARGLAGDLLHGNSVGMNVFCVMITVRMRLSAEFLRQYRYSLNSSSGYEKLRLNQYVITVHPYLCIHGSVNIASN